MNAIAPLSLSHLSDSDLLAQAQRAAHDERRSTAQLIALLTEIDTRRLYLQEGFSSLFVYCTDVLRLSEHAAYGRIEAARAARQYPVIVELLERGEITLTAIGLLRPHLTPENHREVLAKARHQSKRGVELIVAALHPQPDVPSSVRRLPIQAKPLGVERPLSDRTSTPGGAISAEPRVAATQCEMKPLTPERFKIQVTVSRETYDQLRRAQDLMRHTLPSGDPAVIFARALTLLVADLERTKAAQTAAPRQPRPTNPTSRHIPAAVRRAVLQRDGGRCAFRGTQGRCMATSPLEFHHVRPFAAGGAASIDNIELRCRAHNVYEADAYFGPRDAVFSWEVTETT
jgi:hypothetical protein